jgi:hypothetical protein
LFELDRILNSSETIKKKTEYKDKPDCKSKRVSSNKHNRAYVHLNTGKLAKASKQGKQANVTLSFITITRAVTNTTKHKFI